MAFQKPGCVTVCCDRCGDGWTDADPGPHFISVGVAARYVRERGWRVTGTWAVCPTCLAVEACALDGHEWESWRRAGPFPDRRGGTWQGQVRYCALCTSAEWNPPVRPHGLEQEAG